MRKFLRQTVSVGAMGAAITGASILESEREVRELAPAWGRDAYRDFAEAMLATEPAFPCTFAVGAFRRGHLRYAFAESAVEERSLRGVRDGLLEYMGPSREIGRHTSLVTFFRPEREPLSIEEYGRRFWGVLRFL